MTKRLLLLLFLYFIHSSIFSQTNNQGLPQFNYHRDFANILLSTQNDDSENFYTRLLNRFLAADPTMTNAHTLALMIGFTEKPAFKPLENMITEKEIVELVQNGNYRDAVEVSKKLLKTNPLNLMALQQITIAYNNLKIKDSAKYYMKLHMKIMDAMIYSGNGKSPETAIFSLGLADGEYFTKNVGYDIIDKDADWNKRGDFMEIIKASDQEAVNRMFYFVIQHAKLKMDDDKANSDAFNKKLKDSLDKKIKEDKKLAKTKSKIKNKITADSLTLNTNDSTQTIINKGDSTFTQADSITTKNNSNKNSTDKISKKEKSEIKKKDKKANRTTTSSNNLPDSAAFEIQKSNNSNIDSNKINVYNDSTQIEINPRNDRTIDSANNIPLVIDSSIISNQNISKPESDTGKIIAKKDSIQITGDQPKNIITDSIKNIPLVIDSSTISNQNINKPESDTGNIIAKTDSIQITGDQPKNIIPDSVKNIPLVIDSSTISNQNFEMPKIDSSITNSENNSIVDTTKTSTNSTRDSANNAFSESDSIKNLLGINKILQSDSLSKSDSSEMIKNNFINEPPKINDSSIQNEPLNETKINDTQRTENNSDIKNIASPSETKPLMKNNESPVNKDNPKDSDPSNRSPIKNK